MVQVIASHAQLQSLAALSAQMVTATNVMTANSSIPAKAPKITKAVCPAVPQTPSQTMRPVRKKKLANLLNILSFFSSQMRPLLKQHCLMRTLQRQQGLLR
jgi:hypothetical protein